MEYGLRVEHSEPPPSDPRSAAGPGWQDLLPAGRLTALYFGAEFCEQALPAPAEAEALCRGARARGLEPVLLTPVVTGAGLRAVEGLIRALDEQGLRPTVVFNDWGVLRLLRQRFPGLPVRAGRLLNRSLRDPRAAGGVTRGSGGTRLRHLLAREGVAALETDPDLGGGFLGRGDEGLARTLHLPFAFVASGRNCLLKGQALGVGELTRCLGAPCPRPCRSGPRRVRRKDTRLPLWRAGNTVFCRVPPERARSLVADADRIVLHGRPAP